MSWLEKKTCWWIFQFGCKKVDVWGAEKHHSLRVQNSTRTVRCWLMVSLQPGFSSPARFVGQGTPTWFLGRWFVWFCVVGGSRVVVGGVVVGVVSICVSLQNVVFLPRSQIRYQISHAYNLSQEDQMRIENLVSVPFWAYSRKTWRRAFPRSRVSI